MAYKIKKIDDEQRKFLKQVSACACTYCSYVEGSFFCKFNGNCPAGEDEYLEKINKHYKNH